MPPQEPKQGLAGAYQHAWLGMQFAAAILLFLGIGYVLDRLLHTTPGFMIGGTVLGAVMGFLSIYRRIVGGERGDGQNGRRNAEGGRRKGPT